MTGVVLIGFAVLANAKTEASYQDQWCQGKKEVVLDDRTRVDCLTESYAIEIDFASKWKQAIGQSLHYSLKTGKLPGIVLIFKKESDDKYLKQLKRVIEANNLDIKVWVITEKID